MLSPLLALILLVKARNYAILINASKNYSNYRHMADLMVFYNILTGNGFAPGDILAIFPEDPVQNPRNPHGEQIVFHGGKEVKYTRLESSKLDARYLMSILLLRHDKLKTLDENDNLLVFMCGHGRSGFLKICDMYFLFRDDITRAVGDTCRRVAKMLLIIDTCGAESLVDRGGLPGNAFVVTTSLAEESAYSIGVDRKLGVAPVDAFPYELQRTRLAAGMRLVDVFGEIKGRVATSTLTYSQNEDFNVGEFFIQREDEERKTHVFVL